MQLQNFLKESPKDPFLKYALTMEFLKLKDKDKARAGFEELVSEYSDYVGTYYHFGKFLEEEGEKEKAIEIYERGIEVAKGKRNFHAMGELKNALLMANGLLDEDD